jgi:outer membrane protein
MPTASRRPLTRLALLSLLCPAVLPAQRVPTPPRIALIIDEPSPRFQPQVESFVQEIRSFFRPGEIEFLPVRAGDGTPAGLNALLRETYQDSSVSIVVALGSIGSDILARSRPPKPSIAAIVVDASWQGLPQQDGGSGVPNLAYVDQSYPVGSTLIDFQRVIPYRRLAVVLDRAVLQAIPQLGTGADELVRRAGAEAIIIPAEASAAQVLAAVPAGVDAVYLTPVSSMPESEYLILLAGLHARRLPTLSYIADPDVRLGALASYEPPENWRRRARRVAVDLQRIIAGEDAGTLPVRLVSAPRLILNLATARLIGFAPGWSLLTDAELVAVDSVGPADTLSLAQAMRRAVEANLDLAASDLDVASGHQDVLLARASVLPQIESNVTQTYTRSETAAASLGQQPQRKLDGGLTFAVPLYSERAWAGYSSQSSLQLGREAERDQLRLDVVLDASTAYLDVLRARTLGDVQRANLYRSRSNLEVARLRESVGSASRADIYRWQGEVANARRDLIDAEAQIRVASLALKRLLNLPLDRPLAQRAVSLAEPTLLTTDSTALHWLDDPVRFNRLTAFLVQEALRLSPELTRAEASIAAQRRQRTAAGRAFWVPSLNLQGGLTNEFSRGGAGASPSLPVPGLPQAEDMTWQVRLQATLPLFSGFSRTATRAQTSLDLDRLEVQRDGIRQLVDQRVRAQLEFTASSYAAIALTRDAAEAAARNYELVSDAYANGTVPITTLLDAQSAALTSSQSAANAVHDFMVELLRVERAIGAFGQLQPAPQRQDFLQRLQASMRETGQ